MGEFKAKNFFIRKEEMRVFFVLSLALFLAHVFADEDLGKTLEAELSKTDLQEENAKLLNKVEVALGKVDIATECMKRTEYGAKHCFEAKIMGRYVCSWRDNECLNAYCEDLGPGQGNACKFLSENSGETCVYVGSTCTSVDQGEMETKQEEQVGHLKSVNRMLKKALKSLLE